MNDDRFDALLEKCESPIERELLTKLYPHLSPDHTRELEAQKRERIRRDGTRIRLDFAFPDLQIAICCDGREWHEGNPERFEKDRRESRGLQLQSWTVLRFSGREINSDSEMVVDTIQRAIERREWFRNRRTRQQQKHQNLLVLHSGPARQWKHQTQQKPEGGLCGVIFLASVIVGVLVLLNSIF